MLEETQGTLNVEFSMNTARACVASETRNVPEAEHTLQVHMGPALLEADQQHLDQVLAALQHALKPLRKLLPSTSRYFLPDA